MLIRGLHSIECVSRLDLSPGSWHGLSHFPCGECRLKWGGQKRLATSQPGLVGALGIA
jgi:hypothetical protein